MILFWKCSASPKIPEVSNHFAGIVFPEFLTGVAKVQCHSFFDSMICFLFSPKVALHLIVTCFWEKPSQIIPSFNVVSHSAPIQVQLTEQQHLLGGRRECEQAIMLPHDILSCLYEFPHIFHPLITGEPGRIDDYWVHNQDLRENLAMPNLEFWPSWI